MKCSKARQLIPKYVDAELPEEAAGELRNHLADCAECHAEEQSLRRTLDVLGEWPEVPAVGRFEEVMRQVETSDVRRSWLPVPAWAAAGLAAISLATGALFGLYGERSLAAKPPSEVRVAAEMDLNTFAVNDMLEASIQEGMAGGQEVPRKAVEQ